MKILKYIINAVWQFPQNAIGFIVKKVCKATPYATYKDATVFSWNINGGMSLGKYIFVPFAKKRDERFIKHEYGHSVQSKYLGWFYLLVIGIPSLIWAQCFCGYRQKAGASYDDFYTEKWANRLGGVEGGENDNT